MVSIITDGSKGTCTASLDKEPLFDEKTARLLRRRLRRAARIQHPAQKAAALVGHEIVQLEC